MGFDLIPVLIASVCVSVNSRELATLAATTFFLLTFSYATSLWNGKVSHAYEDEKQAPELRLSKGQAVKSFHRKRVDFLRDGFKQTGSWAFQFELLKNRVVAVSGEEGRQMLLRESTLDLYEGFQIVLESVSYLSSGRFEQTLNPRLCQIPKGYDHHQVNSFYKRLLYLQRTDNLSSSESTNSRRPTTSLY